MLKKISNNSFVKKTSTSAFWLILERVIRLFIGLFVYGYFSRYLGPSGLGSYNYALALVTLLLPLATFGIDRIVIRELVRRPEKTDSIVGSAFYIKLILALIVLPLALAILIPLGRLDLLVVTGILGANYIFRSFEVIDLVFQSKVEAGKPVWARTLAFILSTAITIYGVYTSQPLWVFALAFTSEFAANALLYYYLYVKQGFRFSNWKFDPTEAKLLMKSGWPLFLSGISIIIYMKVDQLMIGQLLDDTQLGLYSSVVKISELWNFIPLAIINTLFPAIISLRDNPAKYEKRMQVMYDLLFWGSVVLALGVSVFSPLIIGIIYGAEFSSAAPVLSVHIWSLIFIFLGTASSRQLVAEEKEKIALYRTVLGAVVNIALNIFLIPSMGIMGAAVATLISYSIAAYWGNSLFKGSRNIFIMFIKSLNPVNSFKRLYSYAKELSS